MSSARDCLRTSFLFSLICFSNFGPHGKRVLRQTELFKEVCHETEAVFIEQIVVVLKQAELGMPVAKTVWQVGIAKQTFYRWKKQYGEL
jgi:putative transposase